jgi:hypothetical protein
MFDRVLYKIPEVKLRPEKEEGLVDAFDLMAAEETKVRL